MRRSAKVLVSAASALLLAPLAVAVQSIPANAATGKLLVTTLGHTGVKRSSQIEALNVGQDTQFQGNTGKALSVPDGKYAVIAGINDDNTVETVAEAIVTVRGTGTTRVTLDGRKGRLVKVTLDGKRVTDNVVAQVCAGPVGMAWAGGYQPGGAMYVVPNSSSVFTSAYTALGKGVELSGFAGGVPATLGGAWRSSQLATVRTTVKSGEQNDAYYTYYNLAATPGPGSSNPCSAGPGQLISGVAAPYKVTERVSPGYWNLSTDDQATPGSVGGYYLNDRHFASGHTYDFTLYAAAWAPFGQVADLRPSAVMFGVPEFADPAGNGSEAADKETVALSVNGHLLAKRHLTSWRNGPQELYVPSSTTGWYTLTDDEVRYRPGISMAGVLSPHVTFAWRFHAVPSTVGTNFRLTDGFWPSFKPLGLSLRNSAAVGSTTSVILAFARWSADTSNIPPDSITKVQAWFSADGKHWTSAAAHHIGSGWNVRVPNRAAGTISLRVLATGSHGDTSAETIYRAYAVS